jgi:hypothetical protein
MITREPPSVSRVIILLISERGPTAPREEVPDQPNRRSVAGMRLDARQKTYLAVRGAAALAFLLSVAVLPRGVPAGMLAMAAGLVAVLTCFGTNAGGPGERAGSAPQDRWFDSIRAPQGEWPPYSAGPPAGPAAVSPPSGQPGAR